MQSKISSLEDLLEELYENEEDELLWKAIFSVLALMKEEV